MIIEFNMLSNFIRKVSLCLYAIILMANIALPNLNINASDRVPAENIEQFVCTTWINRGKNGFS